MLVAMNAVEIANTVELFSIIPDRGENESKKRNLVKLKRFIK